MTPCWFYALETPKLTLLCEYSQLPLVLKRVTCRSQFQASTTLYSVEFILQNRKHCKGVGIVCCILVQESLKNEYSLQDAHS